MITICVSDMDNKTKNIDDSVLEDLNIKKERLLKQYFTYDNKKNVYIATLSEYFLFCDYLDKIKPISTKLNQLANLFGENAVNWIKEKVINETNHKMQIIKRYKYYIDDLESQPSKYPVDTLENIM